MKWKRDREAIQPLKNYAKWLDLPLQQPRLPMNASGRFPAQEVESHIICHALDTKQNLTIQLRIAIMT